MMDITRSGSRDFLNSRRRHLSNLVGLHCPQGRSYRTPRRSQRRKKSTENSHQHGKSSPSPNRNGVIRKANARCENVCQFIAPVVSPFKGNTATAPSIPPTKEMSRASTIKENTTLPAPKPRARRVAISRERSATAEYIVFKAPNTAPMPMIKATIPPSHSIIVRQSKCGIALRNIQFPDLCPR